MVELSRRGLFLASGAVATSVLAGTQSAEAATRRPQIEVYAVTPERVAIVGHLPGGELWAFQDGEVGVRCVTQGLAVTSVKVRREARSDVTISVPGHDDFTVAADTRRDALRASLLRVVNKRIALGRDDEPKKLVEAQSVLVDERVKKPLDDLFARAKRGGVALQAISAHRDFDGQKKLYDDYAKRDGSKAADTYSARPGHSEHQLGLAVDVRGADGQHELVPAFKDTPAGRWIAAHAHECGFILRYPEHQKSVTGYEPEPWHLRYVGPDVARFMQANPEIATLERLFDLPDAPDY